MGEKGSGWGKPDEFGEGVFDKSGVVLSNEPKTLEQLAILAAKRKLAEGKEAIDTEKGIDDPDLAGFLDRAGDDVGIPATVVVSKKELPVDEFDDSVGVSSGESVDIGLHIVQETNGESTKAATENKTKKDKKKDLRYESVFKDLEDQLYGILEEQRGFVVEKVTVSRNKDGTYLLTALFKHRGPGGKKFKNLQITGSSHDDLKKTVAQKSLGLPQSRKRR